MKKKILIRTSIVLICLVLLGALTWLIPFAIFSYANRWRYNAEFEECKAEFLLVKDYVYDNLKGREDWVFVSYDRDQAMERIYSPSQHAYLPLPEDVQAALNVIGSKEAFPCKDANLDVIRIEEGRVSFCIENGHYALVWSPQGKPAGVGSSDDGEKTHVKKIAKEWYHVVRDSG